MKPITRKLKIGSCLCSSSGSGLDSTSEIPTPKPTVIPIPIPDDIKHFMINRNEAPGDSIKDLGEVVLGGKYLVIRGLKNVLKKEGYLDQVMDKTKGLPVDVVHYLKRTQTPPDMDCYFLAMELKHKSDDAYSLRYLGNGRPRFGYGENESARTANFWSFYSFSDGNALNGKFCFAFLFKDEETTPEG